jgi:hypothetical protein
VHLGRSTRRRPPLGQSSAAMRRLHGTARRAVWPLGAPLLPDNVTMAEQPRPALLAGTVTCLLPLLACHVRTRDAVGS